MGTVVYVPCPQCEGEKDSRAVRCARCAYKPVLRFWRNVDQTGNCWLWIGKQSIGGYGRMRVGSERKVLAHRYSYELHIGPIPADLDVLHVCDTPACVNPDHLWVGTHTDNMRDAAAKGRLGKKVAA